MPERIVEIRYRFDQRPPHQQNRSATRSEARRPPLPRITRLMALAIQLEERLRERSDLDYRVIANAGRVSRARITQILNLLNLAPDIQERLLNLAPVVRGREPVTEKGIRQLTGEHDWEAQRERLERLMARRVTGMEPRT